MHIHAAVPLFVNFNCMKSVMGNYPQWTFEDNCHDTNNSWTMMTIINLITSGKPQPSVELPAELGACQPPQMAPNSSMSATPNYP